MLWRSILFMTALVASGAWAEQDSPTNFVDVNWTAAQLIQKLGNRDIISASPASMIEYAGIDLAKKSRVILPFFSRKVGDNVIFNGSLSSHFLRTYPRMHVYELSPVASLRQAGDRFHPVELALAAGELDQASAIDTAMSSIARYLDADSFVFWNTAMVKSWANSLAQDQEDRSAMGRYIETKLWQLIAEKGASGFSFDAAPPGSFHFSTAEFRSSQSRARATKNYRSVDAKLEVHLGNQERTIYEAAALHYKLIFGDGFRFGLDRSHIPFLPEKEELAEIKRWLPQVDLNEALVMINFAAAGKPWVAKQNFDVEILRAVSPRLRAHFPYLQFVVVADLAGRKKEFQALSTENIHFIGLESSRIWNNLLDRTQFLVTWDTGMTHLASAILPPEKVLIFSSHRFDRVAALADFWKRPGSFSYSGVEPGHFNIAADRIVKHLHKAFSQLVCQKLIATQAR